MVALPAYPVEQAPEALLQVDKEMLAAIVQPLVQAAHRLAAAAQARWVEVLCLLPLLELAAPVQHRQ